MPKVVELTVEINIQKVSCPGVWLCQHGKVSLSVYALGTSYQTCLLPPMFPLLFKDVFYFKKKFEETCAVNNIGCLLKDEAIYCELVQWSENCPSEECVVLSQYLGNLRDVLFPPNMCSSDGVDLLMRRSKHFPGILSPKIEIATKVRIDELWNPKAASTSALSASPCECSPQEEQDNRQKQVCHTAQYHRNKCMKSPESKPRCPSGYRSNANSSFLRSDLNIKKPSCYTKQTNQGYIQPGVAQPSRHNESKYESQTEYYQDADCAIWRDDSMENCYLNGQENVRKFDSEDALRSDSTTRMLLESRYIDISKRKAKPEVRKHNTFKLQPCICEICRKYHDFFHGNT